ncbi:hypothetical protein BDK51DRAFT_38157, partial [Blyttiomyces helicus]
MPLVESAASRFVSHHIRLACAVTRTRVQSSSFFAAPAEETNPDPSAPPSQSQSNLESLQNSQAFDLGSPRVSVSESLDRSPRLYPPAISTWLDTEEATPVASLPVVFEAVGAVAVIEMCGYGSLVAEVTRRGEAGGASAQLIARALELHWAKVRMAVGRGVADWGLGEGLFLSSTSWPNVQETLSSMHYTSPVHNCLSGQPDETEHSLQIPFPTPVLKIRFSSDRMVVCWRMSTAAVHAHSLSLHSSADPGPEPRSPISPPLTAGLLASLCCILCVTILKDMEFWALEDVSPDFHGITLPLRCGVGCGELFDSHIGIPRLRVQHFVYGSAASAAGEVLEGGVEPASIRLYCPIYSRPPGEVAISPETFKSLRARFAMLDIIGTERSRTATILVTASSLISNLQSTAELICPDIAYGPDLEPRLGDTDPAPTISSGLLQAYLSGSALQYIRTALAKKGADGMKTHGEWRPVSIVTVRVAPKPVHPRRGAERGADRARDAAARAHEGIMLALRCCKRHGLTLLRAELRPTGFVDIFCVTQRAPEVEQKDFATMAIKTALTLRDAFTCQAVGSEGFSIAVASGIFYEGILVTRHRYLHRLIGGLYIRELVIWSRRDEVHDCAPITLPECSRTILTDSLTYDSCASTHLAGYFSPEPFVPPNPFTPSSSQRMASLTTPRVAYILPFYNRSVARDEHWSSGVEIGVGGAPMNFGYKVEREAIQDAFRKNLRGNVATGGLWEVMDSFAAILPSAAPSSF